MIDSLTSYMWLFRITMIWMKTHLEQEDRIQDPECTLDKHFSSWHLLRLEEYCIFMWVSLIYMDWMILKMRRKKFSLWIFLSFLNLFHTYLTNLSAFVSCIGTRTPTEAGEWVWTNLECKKKSKKYFKKRKTKRFQTLHSLLKGNFICRSSIKNEKNQNWWEGKKRKGKTESTNHFNVWIVSQAWLTCNWEFSILKMACLKMAHRFLKANFLFFVFQKNSLLDLSLAVI